jgi:hypothetical protein
MISVDDIKCGLCVSTNLQKFAAILFNFCINKLRDIICNTNACADDVTINTYSDQDAQILIDIAADFTNLERYELQPSKTNIFRIKPSYRLSISMNG